MQIERDRLYDWGWLAFWAVLSTAWCWTSAHAIGATFDEPFYVYAGLKNWHGLNHRELLAQGTMPLATEIQMLPLFLAEQFGGADPLADLWTWLPAARMMTALFWWTLLWASQRVAGSYGGVYAGRLAVALVASEPILLGHASLATTDIAFSACLLTLVATFLARRDESAWRHRILVPALWCALTMLAKASAIVFVPVCLTVVEVDRLLRAGWRPGRTWDAWRPVFGSVRDLASLGLLGLVFVFVVCPRASRGLLFQLRHNADGHGASFLLGEVSPDGFSYYFAAALAIKLGLPVFVLLTLVLVTRPRYFFNAALIAALALLALTPTFKVQIGVRLVMPIAVLTLVSAAIAFAKWRIDEPTAVRRTLANGFATLLIAWSIGNACWAWPHGICFTNELAGGTANGYRALGDSNYDWGQGLKDLAAWQKQHPAVPLNVCYWGTDLTLPNLPVRPVSISQLATREKAERTNAGCFLAVSTNYCAPGLPHLNEMKPCARTMTFLIYDFRKVELTSR